MARTHARALKQTRRLEPVAVCDALPEAAASLAENLGVPARSYADVLADPEVDAVLLTTPTPTHAALIQQVAAAGKHIFVEKPVAATLEDAERVVQAVADAKIQCQVGFQRRYDPAYREAKRLVDAGELGTLMAFRGVSRDPAPPPLEFLKTSGGLMVDLGVHDLDTMRFLVGEVAEVRAVGSVQRTPELARYKLFDAAVAIVRFENGALGTLELGLHTPYGYDIRAEVIGARSRVDLEMTSPLHLTRYTAEGAVKRGPQGFEERFLEAYIAELEAFAHALQSGQPVSPDAADATKTLRLALAAQHALETGETVQVSSFSALRAKVDA